MNDGHLKIPEPNVYIVLDLPRSLYRSTLRAAAGGRRAVGYTEPDILAALLPAAHFHSGVDGGSLLLLHAAHGDLPECAFPQHLRNMPRLSPGGCGQRMVRRQSLQPVSKRWVGGADGRCGGGVHDVQEAVRLDMGFSLDAPHVCVGGPVLGERGCAHADSHRESALCSAGHAR